jgi:outer membrane protein assembly factor BamB
VATGQDPEHGEGLGNLLCLDATRTGDITSSGILWRYKGLQRSLSSVSITPEGLLFVADFSGFLHCLHADTGVLYWRHDLKAHVWGSPFVADGKVYIGDEDGDFTIFAASRHKNLLHETNLLAPIYSSAVAANGVLYLNSNSLLLAIQVGATNRP